MEIRFSDIFFAMLAAMQCWSVGQYCNFSQTEIFQQQHEDIHGFQRMNPTVCDELLIVPLAPP